MSKLNVIYQEKKGSGYGYGSGSSDGSGSGSGYGSGDGSGDGDGDGDGIKKLRGLNVYIIDDIQTIITKLRNNVAKGFIVNNDLSLTPSYIVKQNNLFAHGKTLKEAISSLEDKLFDGLSTEERIAEFWKVFNQKDRYSGNLFFEWHNKLTRSCLIGRESFVKKQGC
jgi:hypothetical protein